jgi:hypothetical protein
VNAATDERTDLGQGQIRIVENSNPAVRVLRDHLPHNITKSGP